MVLPLHDTPARASDSEAFRRAQRRRNQAAIDLIDALMSVDEAEAEEQRETLEFLRSALNEDRLSDRDRFAPK